MSHIKNTRTIHQYLVIVVISLFLLEVVIRLATVNSGTNVELFMNLKHRYMLPLPTAPEYYYKEGIAETQAHNYRAFDDTLGWSHNPWGVDTLGDFQCFANEIGARVTKSEWLEKIPSKNHYNVITIGNSFTHGDAVAAEDTWPFILAQKSGKTIANLGVGGYGLQQALMRLMFSGITADTVIFGAIWGDFERAREPVYNFYQGGNKTRPLLDFETDGGYQLINVPVITPEAFYLAKEKQDAAIFGHIPGYDQTVFSEALWTKSYFLRLLISISHQKKYFKDKPIYLTDGTDLDHCLAIFQLFNDYCRENDMYPIVLLLDTSQNFWHKEKWQLENPWTLFKGKLEDHGITHLDFHEELFKAYSQDQNNLIHPVENLHYSPEGNKLVSKLLLQKLFTTKNIN